MIRQLIYLASSVDPLANGMIVAEVHMEEISRQDRQPEGS